MTRLLPMLQADSGSVLVETVLAMSSLIIVLIGIMEFSQALYADVFIGYAAHSATRYAMVRGASWSPTNCSATIVANCTAASSDITTYVKSITPLGLNTSNNVSVSTSWPGTSASGATCGAAIGPASPGCVVQIKITYDFHLTLPLISQNPFVLQSISSVTIAQ
jgi:Flp pilus assembly protein TadG